MSIETKVIALENARFALHRAERELLEEIGCKAIIIGNTTLWRVTIAGQIVAIPRKKVIDYFCSGVI